MKIKRPALAGAKIKLSKKINCPVRIKVIIEQDTPTKAEIEIFNQHNHGIGLAATKADLLARNLDNNIKEWITQCAYLTYDAEVIYSWVKINCPS